MKKLMIGFVALAVSLFSSVGFAAAQDPEQKFILPVHSFEIRPEISHIEYKEPGVMEEEGIMYGIGAAYTLRSPDDYMLQVEGKFSYGQVDYENSGTMDDIDDYMFEIRGLLGYDFRILDKTMITPYVGVGYRYLNDDMSGMTSSTGASGYERESNYYYSPVGIKTLSYIGNGWLWGITAEFDYFWKGKQKSHFSDILAGLNDPENDQDDGYGYRASIEFRKELGMMSFAIEPFIRYWDIDESDHEDVTYHGSVIGDGFEPANESTEIGIILAVMF
ncbi:MAG: outer membrane beta-barrel protein [Desulfurivibrionaceae bacterium]